MQTVAPHPTTGSPSTVYDDRRRSRRRHALSLGGRLGETLAVLFALAVACTLWSLGAYFSLACLRQLGIPIDQLGLWQWAIPAGISIIELRWWPRIRLTEHQLGMFALVGGLDLLSTVYGVITWARGRALPLGSGFTIPVDGAVVIIPALGVSLVLTFVPERLVLWGISELRAIWRSDNDA